jgi:hypothetical protein
MKFCAEIHIFLAFLLSFFDPPNQIFLHKRTIGTKWASFPREHRGENHNNQLRNEPLRPGRAPNLRHIFPSSVVVQSVLSFVVWIFRLLKVLEFITLGWSIFWQVCSLIWLRLCSFSRIIPLVCHENQQKLSFLYLTSAGLGKAVTRGVYVRQCDQARICWEILVLFWDLWI